MKKIYIKGTIIGNDDSRIYDWLGMESTCPHQVTKVLHEANGGDIEIYINSPGGNVFAASEMFAAIREYKET